MFISKSIKAICLLLLVINISACKKENTSEVKTPESPSTGTVTDIEGNIYKTIKIGNQWWMAENLKTTKYRNGDQIPNITDNSAWAALSSPAYCWYENNKDIYGTTNGALYNWFAIDAAGNGNRNLCPTGWHIPTQEEWTTLITYLGGLNAAGGKMKESGTSHWSAPNTGATNESGFTALPAGFRGYVDGSFQYLGSFSHFWSSTQADATLAWNLGLFNLEAAANNSASIKKLGFSIRCIKD